MTNNLGALLFTQSKFAESLPMLQHSAAITYVALGADNQVTKNRWNNLTRAMAAAAGIEPR